MNCCILDNFSIRCLSRWKILQSCDKKQFTFTYCYNRPRNNSIPAAQTNKLRTICGTH